MPDDTSTSRIPRRQRRTTEKSVEPAVPFEAPDSNDELAVSLEKVRRARKSPSASSISLEKLTKSIQDQDAITAPVARRPRRRAVKDTEPQVEPQPSEFNDPLLATSTPTKSTEVSDVPATVEIASISDPGDLPVRKPRRREGTRAIAMTGLEKEPMELEIPPEAGTAEKRSRRRDRSRNLVTSLPESEPSENIIGVTNSATTAEAPVPTNVLSLIANDAIVETVVEPAVETAGLEIEFLEKVSLRKERTELFTSAPEDTIISVPVAESTIQEVSSNQVNATSIEPEHELGDSETLPTDAIARIPRRRGRSNEPFPDSAGAQAVDSIDPSILAILSGGEDSSSINTDAAARRPRRRERSKEPVHQVTSDEKTIDGVEEVAVETARESATNDAELRAKSINYDNFEDLDTVAVHRPHRRERSKGHSVEPEPEVTAETKGQEPEVEIRGENVSLSEAFVVQEIVDSSATEKVLSFEMVFTENACQIPDVEQPEIESEAVKKLVSKDAIVEAFAEQEATVEETTIEETPVHKATTQETADQDGDVQELAIKDVTVQRAPVPEAELEQATSLACQTQESAVEEAADQRDHVVPCEEEETYHLKNSGIQDDENFQAKDLVGSVAAPMVIAATDTIIAADEILQEQEFPSSFPCNQINNEESNVQEQDASMNVDSALDSLASVANVDTGPVVGLKSLLEEDLSLRRKESLILEKKYLYDKVEFISAMNGSLKQSLEEKTHELSALVMAKLALEDELQADRHLNSEKIAQEEAAHLEWKSMALHLNDVLSTWQRAYSGILPCDVYIKEQLVEQGCLLPSEDTLFEGDEALEEVVGSLGETQSNFVSLLKRERLIEAQLQNIWGKPVPEILQAITEVDPSQFSDQSVLDIEVQGVSLSKELVVLLNDINSIQRETSNLCTLLRNDSREHQGPIA